MERERRGETSECALTRGRREREREKGQRAIGRNQRSARDGALKTLCDCPQERKVPWAASISANEGNATPLHELCEERRQTNMSTGGPAKGKGPQTPQPYKPFHFLLHHSEDNKKGNE